MARSASASASALCEAREATVPFTLTVLLLAVLVSYLRGGRLHRIANAPMRWSGLLFLGLAVQAGVEFAARQHLILNGETAVSVALVSSRVLVLIWVLRNRHLPGVLLIGTGLVLNATVIAANGGMPVDRAAIDALGLEGTRIPVGRHTPLTDDTLLPWLGGIWAIPLLRSIVSIGDVILALGLLPLTHGLMSYRPVLERRRTALARHRAEQQRAIRSRPDEDHEEQESEAALFDEPDGSAAEQVDGNADRQVDESVDESVDEPVDEPVDQHLDGHR